jgi:hypothetical protein
MEEEKFKCLDCNIIFKYKSQYNNHKNRKKSCIINYKKIAEDKYVCKYCDIEYTRSTYVNNHMETCYKKIKYDNNKIINNLNVLLEEKEDIINDLKIKVQKLEIELNIIKKKKKTIQTEQQILPNTNNIITTNSHNTTTNSNNIMENSNNTMNNTIIVNFGKESISKLSAKDKKEILQECMLSISKCVEKVHFNDALPNQKNTYLTSLKAQHGFKYLDGGFIATDLDELVDEILEKRKEDVREILENRKDIKISKFTIDKIYDLLNQLDNRNQEKIDIIRKEIKYVLYNNRNKIIK